MPISTLRALTGRERSRQANHRLALMLAFVAGASNAGGFIAVRQYTSHMSGIVSAMADNIALGDILLFISGTAALASFVAGAAASTVLINFGRRRRLHAEYAFPLFVEAVLMIVFGAVGGRHGRYAWLLGPATVMLLCFIMGLQNAMVTKLSKAEIRTTHVTGMVTDIGIELGRMLYWNRSPAAPDRPAVRGDRRKLRLLSSLVGLFFGGGVIGAWAFARIGFSAALPLAAILLLLAAVPVSDDLSGLLRRVRR